MARSSAWGSRRVETWARGTAGWNEEVRSGNRDFRVFVLADPFPLPTPRIFPLGPGPRSAGGWHPSLDCKLIAGQCINLCQLQPQGTLGAKWSKPILMWCWDASHHPCPIMFLMCAPACVSVPPERLRSVEVVLKRLPEAQTLLEVARTRFRVLFQVCGLGPRILKQATPNA